MTSIGDAGRLLTIDEAARQFRVSVSTMYRWCRTGRLPAFKIGRGWLIPLGSVPEHPGERLSLVREHLRRAVHVRARERGQHWLVLSQSEHDYQQLRESVERFVLSRRRTRLGRLLWDSGPEFSCSVAGKSGGFEARVVVPPDLPPEELERGLRDALAPQAERAAITYVLSESELGDDHADCDRIVRFDEALGRVAASLRLTVVGHRLLPTDHPAADALRAVLGYEGVIVAFEGRVFVIQGRELTTHRR